MLHHAFVASVTVSRRRYLRIATGLAAAGAAGAGALAARRGGMVLARHANGRSGRS
jgi:hypothetical protein